MHQTYELKYRDFHGTLIEIGRLVLDDLDSDNLVCPDVLTLGDLTKSPLTEDIEDEIPDVRSAGQHASP